MKMSIKLFFGVAAVFAAVQINEVTADVVTTLLQSILGNSSSITGILTNLPPGVQAPADLLTNVATANAKVTELLNAAMTSTNAGCSAAINTAYGPLLSSYQSALTGLQIATALGFLNIPAVNTALVTLNNAALTLSTVSVPAICSSP